MQIAENPSTRGTKMGSVNSNISSDASLFGHVALFTSLPLYWTVFPAYQTALKHADSVARLLRWALSWPGATLGIDPEGIGLLLRSIHLLRGGLLDPKTGQLLDRLGATEAEVVSYPNDLRHFGSETDRLLALLSQAKRGAYVWIDREEAEWWIQKTQVPFQDYAQLCGGDEFPLLYLFIRHRCTVFASFNAQYAPESLQSFLPQEVIRRMRTMLSEMQAILEERFEVPPPIYWSWRLVHFSDSGGDLIYQPMLALWNYWPASRRWAPPPPEKQQEVPSLTPEQAASLLEDVFWEKMETYFAIVRQGCGLGFAEPEFAEKSVRSPVFYFAAPRGLPAQAEVYRQAYRPSLYPLVSSCLGSDDPFSLEVAWGVLEGNLLALRRERADQRRVAAWYLLLPFAPKAVSQEGIERDLDFVTDKMTVLEFSIGHAAGDVDTDTGELATRYARWGGSLNGVSEQMSEAMKLLVTAKPGGRARVKGELIKLLWLLRRVHTFVEKTSSDTQQALRKFQGYLDRTEDFLRRAFTYASPEGFAGRSLLEALLDAYPYHYLQEPVRALKNMMETVSANLSGLIEAGMAAVEQMERFEQESQRRWTRLLSLLVGALALLIALPQFVPGSVLTEDTYPKWLAQIMPLPVLEALVRVGVGLILGVLIMGGLAYFVYGISRYFVRREDPAMRRIQAFWDLVEESSSLAPIRRLRDISESAEIAEVVSDVEVKLEQLDEEASRLLCVIFGTLRQAERRPHTRIRRILRSLTHFWRAFFCGRGVSEWLERNARLRQFMALFDLRPDNVPLPRALCLLHYKGSEFQSRSSISDWEFERSLRLAGFSSGEADRLKKWLSLPANQEEIKTLMCENFLSLLKKYGVTAKKNERKLDQWEGIIKTNEHKKSRAFLASECTAG